MWMLRLGNLILLIFIFTSCKDTYNEETNFFNTCKVSSSNIQKGEVKKRNISKDSFRTKQLSVFSKPLDEMLFPKQKSFTVMKAGDVKAKFKFNINRNRLILRKGIKFYKVVFSYASDDENKNDDSFFLGLKNDSLFRFISNNDNQSHAITFFFAFNETKKRPIIDMELEGSAYLLHLDSVYNFNNERVYKIKYKYNFSPFPEPGESVGNKNLPEWEILEMNYTKNSGLIKAVVKNNKDSLTYIALPDN